MCGSSHNNLLNLFKITLSWILMFFYNWQRLFPLIIKYLLFYLTDKTLIYQIQKIIGCYVKSWHEGIYDLYDWIEYVYLLGNQSSPISLPLFHVLIIFSSNLLLHTRYFFSIGCILLKFSRFINYKMIQIGYFFDFW